MPAAPHVPATTGPTEPAALPMAGQRPERADAAANRERILVAARHLLEEHGVEGLTMQAVATAAGVGKGTVSHRFGSRDGLTAALVDDYMRVFQDRFLHGPPPLGPGAPPLDRLEAFFVEFVALQVEHLAPALAAVGTHADEVPPVQGALLVHVASLLVDIDETLDVTVVSAYLLGAVAPPVLNTMHTASGIDVPALQGAIAQLVRGLGARAAD